MTDVVMPQLGETVTEGTITKWFKQVGDDVAEDDILFEVSTDKVDSEVPSPVSGVLSEILVAEGDTVDVGTVLARMGGAGEAPAPAAAAEPAPPEPEPASPEPEPAASPAEPEPVVTGPAPVAEPAPAPPEPAPPEPAPPAPAPAPPEPASPSPEPAAPEPAPVGATAEQQSVGAVSEGDGRLLSPVVRRLLADHELDAAAIAGTGLGGRITRADVEQAIQARGPAPAATPPAPAPAATPAAATPAAPAPAAAPVAAAAAEVAPAAEAAPAGAAPGSIGDQAVALTNIRRRTGEHMVMSKATSPHVLTAVEVDFEGVERVRSAHKAEWKSEEGFSLTYLPFIVRAVADAIAEFPHMNASMGDGELLVHGSINMAIAVDLDFQGLLAPVVRAAETKRLRAISREVVDLATRARSKKLGADEISGGTFTITNPGQYGTMMQFPIINQPQVAILSTDGISRKPVVISDADGNEAIAVHSVGVLALAWDHRAFDGAYVAAFLHRLRSIIETRDWEAEI